MPTTPPTIAVTDLIGTDVAPSVARPQYERGAVTAGIAHVGVGNFHRVNQALYVDACLHLPGQSSPFAALHLADHPEFVDHYLALTAQIDQHGMAADTSALTSDPAPPRTPPAS